MKYFNTAKYLAFICLMTSVSAIANDQVSGPRIGNGADAYVDTAGRARLLDLVRSPSTLGLTPIHEDQEAATLLKGQLQNLELDRVTHFPQDMHSQSFSKTILETIDELKWYLVPGPLPDVNDRGVVVISKEDKGGHIVRLAIQFERKVFVDLEYYLSLQNDPTSRAGLYLHEGLIARYIRDNYERPVTTEQIASFVNQFFNASPNLPAFLKINPERAFKALCDMGIRVARPLIEDQSIDRYAIGTWEYKIKSSFYVYENSPDKGCPVYQVEVDTSRSPQDDNRYDGLRASRRYSVRVRNLSSQTSSSPSPWVEGTLRQFSEKDGAGYADMRRGIVDDLTLSAPGAYLDLYSSVAFTDKNEKQRWGFKVSGSIYVDGK